MFQSSIDRSHLLLIEELFSVDAIAAGFYLAGGTALTFHRGHRKSVDIDLFNQTEFDEDRISDQITKRNGVIISMQPGTVHGIVQNIKVTFLHYPYPLILPLATHNKIKLASLEDIGCMKAVSISQRAEKKDFFDMFEILKVLRPEELKACFFKKYGENRINCYHVLRSFFYYDDVEDSPDPISLNGTTWNDVKKWFMDNEKGLTTALLC